MSTYHSKAKDSFYTRMRFFKFNCVVNEVDFTKENFLKFKLVENEDLIHIYTSQYYQWETNNKLEGVKTQMQIKDIYDAMKQINLSREEKEDWYQSYYKSYMLLNYPKDEFYKDKQADTCYYCDTTLEMIRELAARQKLFKKNERGFVMEIDRKKPNLEYATDNCVPACYWCNNAKTDEFDDEDFAQIGKQIGIVLKERLLG